MPPDAAPHPAINSTIPLPSGATLVFSHQPSFTAVLRAVKAQEHGLLNCIASILADSRFVVRVTQTLPTLPVIPNLRCGLWYVDQGGPRSQTSYFKSTDGHTNNWGFSTTRLNLNVATAAGRHGGAFIVDATRRGKRFPDALSKTVPIWAAVLNRAIGTYHRHHPGTNRDTEVWFQDIRLPPWVESSERDQIQQRVEAWTGDFLAVCVDVSELAQVVTAPLRCFWVAHNDDWREHVPSEEEMRGWTSLVLVSAALPNARNRQRLMLGAMDVMFDYIPGAADDEESWAKGLTPAALWRHHEALLAAGPDGIEAALQHIFQENYDDDGLGAACHDTKSAARAAGAEEVYWIGSTGLALVENVSALRHYTQRYEASPCGEVPAILHLGRHDITAALKNCSHVVTWLPVSANKADRWALLRTLCAALHCISSHLAAHRRVIVVADDLQTAASVVLAALLACFRLHIHQGRQELVWQGECHSNGHVTVPAVGHTAFDRTVVRQYLAVLAQHCPEARPGKAALKQVFNCFVDRGMWQQQRVTGSETPGQPEAGEMIQ